MSKISATVGDPVIHLVCGSTGAGKSTYARLLGENISAAHLSIDDWMISLFGPDIENPMDWKWISERALRCEKTILSLAISLAKNGTPSILEIGLQYASRRSEVAAIISESQCMFKTHFLMVSAEERWRRVQHRNDKKDDTFRLTVTKEMFDFFEHMWESPSEQEQVALHATKLITEWTSRTAEPD